MCQVQEALDILARKGSALVIAHRLSTIMDSEKIVVVGSAKDGEKQGTVMESGTHEELLAKTTPGEAEEEDDEDTDEEGDGTCCGPPIILCATRAYARNFTAGIYLRFYGAHCMT